MRKTTILFGLAALAATGAAQAQFRLPVIIPLGQGQPQPMPPSAMPPALAPGAAQAEFISQVGSDSVYFPPRGIGIDANGAARLGAQAQWLIANPMVSVRLEGHGDARDTRDYALAIGNRRASAVRDFLVLQGVAPQRITIMSWGKERPGTMRIGPSVVAVGPRVVTVLR